MKIVDIIYTYRSILDTRVVVLARVFMFTLRYITHEFKRHSAIEVLDNGNKALLLYFSFETQAKQRRKVA